MQYSPSQFRRVEHEFLEQFELKTLDFYDKNVSENNFIEYKKIVNQLKTRKHHNLQKIQKIQKIQQYQRNRNLLSRSKLKLKDQYSRDANNDSCQKSISMNKQNYQEDDQDEWGFYITQNVGNSNKVKKNQVNNNNNSKDNSRVQSQHSSLKSQSKISDLDENTNILQLKDKIYGQYSILQCLKHEQSQVQQAIFCFKKRLMKLQTQFITQEIKSKQVDRLLVQNNNQMLHAKHTNQQIKSAFLKTKKHFDLDLQGRKNIQTKFNQKNRQQFQDSVGNHIWMKKMKQHLQQQEMQLKRLDEIRHTLEKKQRKYVAIYKKQQQLYKLYEQIKELVPPDLSKRPIVSILDTDFAEMQLQRRKSHKKQVSAANLHILKKTSIPQFHHSVIDRQLKLYEVVNELIVLYNSIKHQQSSKINQFKLLINQRDQKQIEHNKIISRIANDYQLLIQHLPIVPAGEKIKLQQLIVENNQLSQKINVLNSKTNSIQYRLRFYLSKQLMILQKIIEVWMKNDKISNQYVQNLMGNFNQILSLSATSNQFFNTHANTYGNNNGGSNNSRSGSTGYHTQMSMDDKELCIHDSKTMLISFFQNWQDYIGFLDILHQNSYIYRFMNKNKLFKLFKRIIKTKLTNKQLPTEDIFQKALEITFSEGRQLHMIRVFKLLQVFKDFQTYFQKVQKGVITLNCAPNYHFLQAQQIDSNDLSKLPSKNQLQRNSVKKQFSSANDRYSMELKFQSISSSNQTKQSKDGTSSDLKKFPTFNKQMKNLKEQDIISKLKKRKQLKTLNIHDFYQNLREEIEKVKKIVQID